MFAPAAGGEQTQISPTSSNPSKLPITINLSSNSTSALPISETKSLVFAEDDHTKAIFHIRMTREQVKQALKVDLSSSAKKSAQLVISVSQMKGDKYNRVEETA